MGQYYITTNLTRKEKLSDETAKKLLKNSYWFGLKLMERSWFFTYSTYILDLLLSKDWCAEQTVIIGDYYKEGKINYSTCKQYKEANTTNISKYIKKYKSDKKELEYMKNWYKDKSFVNFDKKIFIRFDKYITVNSLLSPRGTIHFPSLLIALGNGRGGGDYFGINEDLVGSWAYDRVGIITTREAEAYGFVENLPIFKEE